MAVSPPGTPPPKRRRGCLGCLTGCLIPIVVVVAVVGAGFYFLAGRAQAQVSVPAQLLVVHDTVNLTHAGASGTAHTGSVVHAGDTVDTGTDPNGLARGAIQFEDGSLTRLGPATSLTLSQADFDQSGRLGHVTMTQAAGRSFSTVVKLTGGARFDVKGHSAVAEVRGTQFELITAKDGSATLKVFEGTVHMVGDRDVAVGANQQVTVSPNGVVGAVGPLQPDPADPFLAWIGAENAAAAAGGLAGSDQTSGGAAATGGTTSEPDYDGGGGDVIGTLGYPGSRFKLTITDPAGGVHESDLSTPGRLGGRVVTVVIPSAPLGRYKVRVVAEQSDGDRPELYSVTMATKFVCQNASSDTGGVVRGVLSSAAVTQAFQQSGISSPHVRFAGASSGGAAISGSIAFQGTSFSGGGILYASDGKLGAIITNVTVNGLNITQQVTSQIASAAGHNLDTLDPGYTVERVYSCSSGSDTFLVIEGHH